MLLEPSLLQHHLEVKLSLAESPSSVVEETEAWGHHGPCLRTGSSSYQSQQVRLPELY